MEKKKTAEEEAIQKSKKPANFLKYSGMATQMGAVIGFFIFVGLKLDTWLGTKVIFVLIGALLGVGLSLYSFIRQVTSDNK